MTSFILVLSTVVFILLSSVALMVALFVVSSFFVPPLFFKKGGFEARFIFLLEADDDDDVVFYQQSSWCFERGRYSSCGGADTTPVVLLAEQAELQLLCGSGIFFFVVVRFGFFRTQEKARTGTAAYCCWLRRQ